MQSTKRSQIQAALWEQAFIGCTRVSCPMGRVVAIRKTKGQLQAKVLGWGRWYPVSGVTIEKLFAFGRPQGQPRYHAGVSPHLPNKQEQRRE